MDHAITFTGGLLACVVAGLAIDATVGLLHRLAQRSGHRQALPLLRGVLAALTGVLLGEGLPLLWPALLPWRPVVLGACIGLAFGAMRNGGSMRMARRHATPSAEARP
ncbi:hypothetical protein [Rhodanobacter sp. DHB23]|uniref:hypothetical protein n=1 Tax=Rhodanobacter sp. DHB23 TaxID=2775923 RepID=UPI0017847FA1|nr:hypothetical protein [Rhodanobacter sp. DHB23]MBD8872331.1 hypothetical protein [Rhodanobacter sp. DHB23]